MKNVDWKELFKKCFGKEKDSRYHAIAMLAIYGFFMMILVAVIRTSGNNSSSSLNQNNNNLNSSPVATSSPSNDIEEEASTNSGDINYSYSYTISYNGISEVYLGKKIDDKEKFTLIRDGITTDYAILSDNYLVLENGLYRLTENPSKYFKYCDIEKILLLVEDEIPTENNGTVKYSVSNKNISRLFKDNLVIDNERGNSIQLYKSGDTLKSVDLDLSNYFKAVEGSDVSLTIHMEFADIGTTEDFQIKVS